MRARILLLTAALALSACAPTDEPKLQANVETYTTPVTTSGGFTTENVMKVHTGMKSDTILEMFGAPKDVSQAVCGANLGNPWNCTTWEYGDIYHDMASFTFSVNGGSLVLNNFNVRRK
jgi:hypothetical protein